MPRFLANPISDSRSAQDLCILAIRYCQIRKIFNPLNRENDINWELIPMTPEIRCKNHLGCHHLAPVPTPTNRSAELHANKTHIKWLDHST